MRENQNANLTLHGGGRILLKHRINTQVPFRVKIILYSELFEDYLKKKKKLKKGLQFIFFENSFFCVFFFLSIQHKKNVYTKIKRLTQISVFSICLQKSVISQL